MKCASGEADLITRASVAVLRWINQGAINKTQCTPKHFRRNFMFGSRAESVCLSVCLSETVLLVSLCALDVLFISFKYRAFKIVFGQTRGMT